MNQVGINMGTVKSKNRSAIIRYISKTGPVSRKDMAGAVGLTAASVTQITNQLLQEGILRELGTSETSVGVGRKKILLDINYDFAYLFSVNIEVEKTTVALTNLRGDIVELVEMQTEKSISPEEFLKKISFKCQQIKAGKSDRTIGNIRAVSVGIPGIVDKKTGLSLQAYGIWSEQVKVSDILSRELDLPCIVENNVNAFARATMIFGEGKESDNLHLIKWGPGVGSSIIIDNSIYEGRKGKAAELGHFIVDARGEKCSCGKRGCLETKVSYSALNKIVAFEPLKFAETYKASTGEIREKLDGAIDVLARTLVNAITLLAPNRVVLSGFLFESKDIREKVIGICQAYDSNLSEDRIMYSSLADKEAYIGPVASYWTELY